MESEMMLSIDMQLAIPDFMDASVPLEQIGRKIKNDIQSNIRNGIRFDNQNPLERLREKTIKRKKKLGVPFPRSPLRRFGVMLNAIHLYKINKNAIVIGIISRGKPPRDEVGYMHNTFGETYTWRPFFGVSTKMLEYATERMDRWVKQNIEKAAKKYIRSSLTY